MGSTSRIALLAALCAAALAARAQSTSPEPFRDCEQCPEMVNLPGGQLAMGSPEGEAGRDSDEAPVHPVSIAPFAAGKVEVTFEQWDACVAEQGCSHTPSDERWGRAKRPVVNVSWNDAQEYTKWLSKKTGKRYRLLTESEWEYAARAGTTTPYYWGTAADAACDFAMVRSDWLGCGTGRTGPAGARKPNAFGLYDMSGNVWEWTEDCYNTDYDGAPKDGSAWTSGACERRVTRGGAWDVRAREARSANRNPRSLSDRNYTIGFRVARSN